MPTASWNCQAMPRKPAAPGLSREGSTPEGCLLQRAGWLAAVHVHESLRRSALWTGDCDRGSIMHCTLRLQSIGNEATEPPRNGREFQ